MLVQNIKYYISFSFLLLSLQSSAFDCETQITGFWNTASTWVNCNNTVPQDNDTVVIKNGHTVSLSYHTKNLESLMIESGGDLRVFEAGTSVVNLNSNLNASSSFDLGNATLELENNLTINANNKNLVIGPIDGAYDLVLNSSAETHLTGTVGGVIPIKSLSTDSTGTTILDDPSGGINSETVTVDETIEINDALVLYSHSTLSCPDGVITFNKTIDSGLNDHSLTIKSSQNSVINLNDKVGGISELTNFIIFDTENATLNINTSEIRTEINQKYDLDIVLNSPTNQMLFSTTSPSNGFVRLGDINGSNDIYSDNHTSLIINANIDVEINANVGADNRFLNDISISAPSGIILSKESIVIQGDINFIDSVDMQSAVTIQAQSINFLNDLNMNDFDLTLNIESDLLSSQISGVISGSGDFIKQGEGEIELALINTISGDLTINQGKLVTSNISENVIPSVSVITVAQGATFDLHSDSTGIFNVKSQQTIKGNGFLGTDLTHTIFNHNSSFDPGSSPGRIFANSVSMNVLSQLIIEIDGLIAGTEYDQLVVGDLILSSSPSGNGSELNLHLNENFNPNHGDEFKIIDVTAGEVINGIFANKPEGQRIKSGDQFFTISYTGGDGNDVVLTAIQPSILYVDANALTAGSGLSWADAFSNLQDALNIASIGDEIWVASGVYYPDVGGIQVEDDDTATFTLIEDVSIYGGFNGTESMRDQRNPIDHVTILSGDITQDDDNEDGNFITEDWHTINNTNSKNIINGSLVSPATNLDGFTITAGYANDLSEPSDRGAGMYCDLDDEIGPSVNQLSFVGNYSRIGGSGIYKCTQSVTNSSFINNYSVAKGGAVIAEGGYFNQVTFSGNKSIYSGGAISNDLSKITIENSEFIANITLLHDGGGISTNADITLENVLFKGNYAGSDSGDIGGAIDIRDMTTANFINTTFTGNKAGDFGGAISISEMTSLNIQNSIIWNNEDSTSNTQTSSIYINGGTYTQSHSLIQGFGTVGLGNLDEDPMFITATDPSTAPTSIGNSRLNVESPAINAGDNRVLNSVTDLDGNARIVDSTVDMGAYEHSSNTVSVTVSGLLGGSVVLQNNGADDLTFNSDGSQSFNTSVAYTADYLITVLTQPSSPSQNCTVTNASGTINGSDISDVNVDCEIIQYNVGVDVTGLASGTTLSLLNNSEALDVTGNGLSNFATVINDGSAYTVSITAQPTNPNQECLITSANANGNLNGMDEIITIECTTLQYNVGVDVSGLEPGNFVEFDNNGESLIVNTDGSQNFATALDDGTSYDVNVITQPTMPNQMCSIVSGSGDLDGDDVLISVTCTTNQYLVGGMASGLANGNSVTLSLGAEDLDVDSNNAFVFLNPLIDESSYVVSIENQPTVPNQTCDLINSSGTINGNDVTNLEVNCITNQYSVGGTVTGLHSGNNLVIQNNMGDDLMIASDGDFDFTTTIEDLQSYSVSIIEQPTNPIQTCMVSQNSGNVSGNNVISVLIVCGFGDDFIFSGGFE